MKNIVLQHNMFLQNMAIVPNFNIKDDDREQVKTIRILIIFLRIRSYKKVIRRHVFISYNQKYN